VDALGSAVPEQVAGQRAAAEGVNRVIFSARNTAGQPLNRIRVLAEFSFENNHITILK
jgi:hypothetical protein